MSVLYYIILYNLFIYICIRTIVLYIKIINYIHIIIINVKVIYILKYKGIYIYLIQIYETYKGYYIIDSGELFIR